MGKTDPHRRKGKESGQPEPVPEYSRSEAGDQFLDKVESGLVRALSHAAGLEREFVSHLGHSCLLALSGGPDSTSLLLAMAELRGKLGFELSACHVNHHMRGAESEADELFCRHLAEGIGVELTVCHAQCESHGRASEADLREARYALLAESAHSHGAGFIVVAHTLDDQVETLLFRLLRGTGPSGLVGMETSRPLDGETVLLRPLLATGRADCLEYLERRGQEAVSDSSNTNLDYTRNYIRHRLIPPIKERFPGFEARLEQARLIIAEDEILLDALTDQALQSFESEPDTNQDRWRVASFEALPASLKRRLLAAALSERDIEVSFERVRALLEICRKGGALSLNGLWDIQSDGRFISFVRKDELEEADDQQAGILVEVRVPGLTIAPAFGKALRVEVWSEKERSGAELDFPDRSAFAALVDLSRVKLPLEIRARRPGDLIRPFGMNELVRLKKFLHNQKSDRTQRRKLIVLADQEEVLWVPGVGLGNKLRVDDKPSHRLSWLDLAPDESEVC